MKCARWLPYVVIAAGVLTPGLYLLIRALETDVDTVSALIIRWRTVGLIGNTLALAVSVLVFGTLIAFPLAWLSTRTTWDRRSVITLLGIAPLAIPGYITAYVWLSATGARGVLFHVLGWQMPQLHGWLGATISLTLYTFPYLFLNLRTALQGLNPSMEETAQALGKTAREVLLRVTLPQLRPAFLSGGLVVFLHVLGDFGVVSLMRYETLSYALYLQYNAAFDRTYAAWIGLILLTITALMLWFDAKTLRRSIQVRGRSSRYQRTLRNLSTQGKVWAGLFLVVVASIAVLIPVATMAFWGFQHLDDRFPDVVQALWSSASVSGPAAAIAVLLVLPVVYESSRYPSARSKTFERLSYFTYATPPLAFALGVIFFALRLFPIWYQTVTLLILAYALHFAAESMGPIRSALLQTPRQLEEAATTLGRTRFQAFWGTTLPLIRPGLFTGFVFVFLACMKELPITMLLAPPGFETLAMNVWMYTSEILFAKAAPYAFVLVMMSTLMTVLLYHQERANRSSDGQPKRRRK